MLIDDFLKENGKDVEQEIEKLIEDEGDIVMEEQEQEENVDCEEAAETNAYLLVFESRVMGSNPTSVPFI
ncbi:hypothetical protein TSUD_299000 [Trifolium subterraneum]|nr:hypothetical protein TSUD_299000 [Trifolium subterraneum]